MRRWDASSGAGVMLQRWSGKHSRCVCGGYAAVEDDAYVQHATTLVASYAELSPPPPPLAHDDTSILRAQLRGIALQQSATQRMLRNTLTGMGMGVPSGGDGVVMERRKGGVKSEELEL